MRYAYTYQFPSANSAKLDREGQYLELHGEILEQPNTLDELMPFDPNLVCVVCG